MKEVPMHLLSNGEGETIMPGNYSAREGIFFNQSIKVVGLIQFHLRQNRFKSNLSKNYLICTLRIGRKVSLLTHVDRDGNVSQSNFELKGLGLADKLQIYRCPMQDAHATLKDIVEGEKPWPESAVRELQYRRCCTTTKFCHDRVRLKILLRKNSKTSPHKQQTLLLNS